MTHDGANLQTYFGLPSDVRFCTQCVISNQRPNSTVEFFHRPDSKKETIFFDENGVCDACRVAEKKKTSIDWQDRNQQLKQLCDRFRRSDGHYDCVVPGSGGKDSFFAAHVLKTQYGMHPLTVTWAPHLYTDWGWRNQQRWIHAGFDNILFTPNGRVHRLLTRVALEKLFHPFQPFILGQKHIGVEFAQRYNIPLVFYGENEAEYGNPIRDMSQSQRDKSYWTLDRIAEAYVGGVSVSDWIHGYGLEWVDLKPYLPTLSSSEDTSVQVHYLGYYIPWHPQSCYYYAVEQGGFEPAPERTVGTYSKYNSIDDKMDDFHYYTTWIKFGLGRASYDAAQEIRSRDITRDEGVALVKRYDGEFPARFANELFDYLSIDAKEYPVAVKKFEKPRMTMETFMDLANQFRSPHLWQKLSDQWQLRHVVWSSSV